MRASSWSTATTTPTAMTELILDGLTLKSREELHDALTQGLHLPSYFGRNLDALFDCMTERREETRLCLRNAERLPCGRKLLQVLRDAAAENPSLHIETEDGPG